MFHGAFFLAKGKFPASATAHNQFLQQSQLQSWSQIISKSVHQLKEVTKSKFSYCFSIHCWWRYPKRWLLTLYLPIGQSPLIPHVAVGIKIAANMPLLKIAYKEVTCFFSSKIKSLRVHQIAHIRAVAPTKINSLSFWFMPVNQCPSIWDIDLVRLT